MYARNIKQKLINIMKEGVEAIAGTRKEKTFWNLYYQIDGYLNLNCCDQYDVILFSLEEAQEIDGFCLELKDHDYHSYMEQIKESYYAETNTHSLNCGTTNNNQQ